MLFLLKIIKKLFKIIGSNAAPWQIAAGSCIGILLGFMPLWPSYGWPSPIAGALFVVAVVLNCHLGSMMLFLGFGALISTVAIGPLAALGWQCSGLAHWAADVPLLYASHLSDTAMLGASMVGVCVAPLVALGMYRLTTHARACWLPTLKEKKKLRMAGTMAGNSTLLRIGCWFFDV